MKKIFTIIALALASLLLFTYCGKSEEEEIYYGFSEEDLMNVYVADSTVADMTTSATTFMQMLQAATGQEPKTYYKDTVRMKGDMRCVIRSYDETKGFDEGLKSDSFEGHFSGDVRIMKGTVQQLQNGSAVVVSKIPLEFLDEIKFIIENGEQFAAEGLENIRLYALRIPSPSNEFKPGCFSVEKRITKASVETLYIGKLKDVVSLEPQTDNPAPTPYTPIADL